MDREAAKKEIASHHWDYAVVDIALDEIAREKSKGES
jgi:hypothetical protein